ncbi:uncharacterized protein FIESC28_09791 [Fusarium coffeatum]|uniref:Calcineurin-like phosphoesterase domain-containing protein n=1 Tax=Fusarium coffeatum TaxID=231269 RepID=A0A366QXI8_9HYPO|nr:uncharacterized protein FIESC28_09791 [Fusarium coffeatum]RBR09621.1 hypothetical protein FIESC28_09791 [Fusarium coffeatum]
MTRWKISTRFLIISDTHSKQFPDDRVPFTPVDVAIHCGDLTQHSKLYEFESAINLLKQLNAPLKLVIAGNHDFTLDKPTYKKMRAEIAPPNMGRVEMEYGCPGEATRLMESAAEYGIVYLTEGVHHFDLDNRAHLVVYTSPYTLSEDPWGFQYNIYEGHDWKINEQVDIMITHGPPLQILDQGRCEKHIGCPDLFRTVAQAKPLMHCFGHTHSSWGAELIRWRDCRLEKFSHATAIDEKESIVLENLDKVKWGRKEYEKDRVVFTKHGRGDYMEVRRKVDTLFVNAAIQGMRKGSFNFPFVVELDLPIS